MTDPRRLEPVTFLKGSDSPVSAMETGRHPSMGAPSGEVVSFRDYYNAKKSAVPEEPTEEQLSFRRYVQGGNQEEPVAEPAVAEPAVAEPAVAEPAVAEPAVAAFPDSDIPEP